jgi:hypothetical protein
MRLQSIMYIVAVDPRYHHQAIQSILCYAYITIWPVIFITLFMDKVCTLFATELATE